MQQRIVAGTLSVLVRFFIRNALVLFLAISAASVGSIGAAKAQSFQFSSIAVQGNQRVETPTILTYAGIVRGQPISAAALNDSYQRVLGSGLFDTVEFIPQGGQLLIVVKEFPTVSRINVEGNRKVTDDAALALIKSQPRRVFNASQVEQDAAALTDAYQAQGLYTATVTPRIIQRSNNRVDLVFEVNEGRKVEVERLSFVGNKAFSDGRLRRVLETKQAGILRAIIQHDTFVEDRIEFDKRVLQDFYRERGFVDFRTLNVSSEFSRERNAFFITFEVQEGQSFKFGKISVASETPEANAADFEGVARIRSGQIYSPSGVDDTIARLERLALKKGLNFVRVEPRITRNDRDLTLDISFALVRGERIFVERIDIEGNATTLDQVIRRQFRTVEGDPFNPREIREAAERIRALGLFSNADVNARQGSTADQVVVDVNVNEQLTGSLSFGANYNTAEGVGFTGNYREINFLGRAQTLNFDIFISSGSATGGLTFAEPAFLGRDLRFSLTAQYRQTNYSYTNYDTQTALLRPGFDFPVSDNGRLGLNFALSNDKIFNVDANSSSVLADEEAQGAQFGTSLGYDFSWDNRRSGLHPTIGVVLKFSQDFGALGSDVQYIRTKASAGAETTVFHDEITLRATVEGGALASFGGDSRLNDRFFLGSSQMRGFRPSGIGPRDLTVSNRDALGGNFFAVARFETEFPLGLPEEYGITAGLFYDVGTLWGLDNTAGGAIDDSLHVRQVVGASIFWTTAIGPLRFNFSKVLQQETYDKAQAFDLTISTKF